MFLKHNCWLHKYGAGFFVCFFFFFSVLKNQASRQAVLQALTYRFLVLELRLRQRHGTIPESCIVLCVEDPRSRVGSGGATLNALLVVTEHISAQHGFTVRPDPLFPYIDPSPSSFPSVLSFYLLFFFFFSFFHSFLNNTFPFFLLFFLPFPSFLSSFICPFVLLLPSSFGLSFFLSSFPFFLPFFHLFAFLKCYQIDFHFCNHSNISLRHLTQSPFTHALVLYLYENVHSKHT